MEELSILNSTSLTPWLRMIMKTPNSAPAPTAKHGGDGRKRGKGWLLAIFSFLVSTSVLLPQSYNVDSYCISGGGGVSTGGVYSVSGTIGQHDAGNAMSGGNYAVTGGFWSLLAVVQTPGRPLLTITRSGNSVIVSWPLSPGGFTLQQNGNLANAAGWSTYGGMVNTANGTNSITITPPLGNLFFRLSNP
jgi:hypothetical protein